VVKPAVQTASAPAAVDDGVTDRLFKDVGEPAQAWFAVRPVTAAIRNKQARTRVSTTLILALLPTVGSWLILPVAVRVWRIIGLIPPPLYLAIAARPPI
jgi:hypothetical protein